MYGHTNEWSTLESELKSSWTRLFIFIFVIAILIYFVLDSTQWETTAEFHTLIESSTTLLALVAGSLAMVRYYSKKDIIYIFVGVGFIGAGAFDGYHAFVTSSFFKPYMPSDLVDLIPWSWLASRQYISIVMLVLAILTRPKVQRATTFRLSDLHIFLIAISLTIASFILFAIMPLPQAHYPELFFHRPGELFPAVCFLIGFIGIYRNKELRADPFTNWLLLSIILGFISQALYMSLSDTLFDMEFDVAHLLKTISYITVIIGLMISVYKAFSSLEEAQAQAVAANDAKAEFLALNEHAIVVIADTVGGITYVNDKFCDASGYTRDELIGQSLAIMKPLDQELLLDKSTAESIQAGRIWHGDVKNKTKNGTIIWLQTTIVPFKDDNGEIFKYIALQNDITELKQKEASLSKVFDRFQKYTEASKDWYWETDSDMRFTYVSDHISETIGIPASDLIGMGRDDVDAVIIDPDLLKQHLEDVKARRPYTDFEYGVMRPDGKIAYLRVHGKPFFGDGNEFLGYCGTGTDITRQKMAEEARDQEETFRQSLIENMNQGYWYINKESTILDVNHAMCKILGCSLDEIVGKSFFDFLDAKNVELAKSKLAHDTRNIAGSYEIELQRTDGRNVPCINNRMPIFNEAGDVVGYVGMFTDISQTKEISEKLTAALSDTVKANNDLKYEVTTNIALADILRQTTVAVQEKEVLDITLEALCKLDFLSMTGKGSGFVISQSNKQLQLISGDDLGELWRISDKSNIKFTECSENHPDIPFKGTKPHGHYTIPYRIDDIVSGYIIIHLKHGIEYKTEYLDFLQTVAAVVAVAIKRIRAEKKTIQAERFASLGAMVAGIAHEINTPVGTAVTNISELKDRTTAFEKKLEKGIRKSELDQFLVDAKDFSNMAQDNLARAANLVRSFKQVAVDESSQEERQINMLGHINTIITTMNHEFKRTNVSIKVDCPSHIVISSLPGAWSQIITNLAHNSLIHGFEDGKLPGEIFIKVRWASDANWLVLTYSDTGKGIAKEKMAKIFEPFYTTRLNEGGSGLGMHIVQNLVTQSLDGTIDAVDTDEQGASFLISVPTHVAVQEGVQ